MELGSRASPSRAGGCRSCRSTPRTSLNPTVRPLGCPRPPCSSFPSRRRTPGPRAAVPDAAGALGGAGAAVPLDELLSGLDATSGNVHQLQDALANSSLGDIAALASGLQDALAVSGHEDVVTQVAHAGTGAHVTDAVVNYPDFHSAVNPESHAALTTPDVSAALGSASDHIQGAAHNVPIHNIADASDIGATVASLLGSSGDAVTSASTAKETVEALSFWASSKLAYVQSVDGESYNLLRSTVTSLLDSVVATLSTEADARTAQMYSALTLGLQHVVLASKDNAALLPLAQMIEAQDALMAPTQGSLQLDTLLKLMLGSITLILVSIPSPDHDPMKGNAHINTFKLPSVYDPEANKQYYGYRPVQAMKRQIEIVSQLGTLCVQLLADWRMGQWRQNMRVRATRLVKIVEHLGPAFVKIAQIVSTRVDMMPEIYIEEFSKLQDCVKPFPTPVARKVIEEELGRPVQEVFIAITEEPLASASLGQVYKGKLRPEYGGGEVAIKVQRPEVFESISLDIYLMRQITGLMGKLPTLNDGWCEVLDDWASRFFEEMDYELEANNMMVFAQQMERLDGIKVATVYPDLCSRRVLTTEWVNGQKLSEVSPERIRAVCTTFLNCYLIQLLETGFLHADPHPGNLLLMEDGKLCILDFGLMSSVTEDQQVALIEYITHLSLEDWDGVAEDLVTLGFIPPDVPPEMLEQMRPFLKEVMGNMVCGGGLDKRGINMGQLSLELEGVARKFKLVIPPWFALILRAFGVIEGVALQVDPEYAIVQECFPYLCRRLLSDPNPRMHAALRQLLYGDKAHLDVARLRRLMDGFGSFNTDPTKSKASATTAAAYAATSIDATTSTAPAAAATSSAYAAGRSGSGRPLQIDIDFWGARAESSGRRASTAAAMDMSQPVVDEGLKEALLAVFSARGSYAQELLVDELVAAADILSREAVGEAARMVLGSANAAGALGGLEALAPMRMMFMPVGSALDGPLRAAAAPREGRLSEQDMEALDMVEGIMALLEDDGVGRRASAPSVPDLGATAATAIGTVRGVAELAPILPELLPGLQHTGELFVRGFARRLALRMAADMEEGPERDAILQAADAAAPPHPTYG